MGRCLIFCVVVALWGSAEALVDSDASLSSAITGAVDGAVIHLRAGRYRAPIVLEKEIHLVGDGEVRIDPSEPLPAKWGPAPEIGAGVWKSSLEQKPYELMVDGKIVAALREDRVQTEGDWHWKTLLAKGPPRSGFTQIRALWLWREAEKTAYVTLGGADPSGRTWSWMPTGAPALHFKGARGATVRGLAFAGAFEAVRFDSGARGCVLRDCTLASFSHHGIILDGGAHSNLIVSNAIQRGSYESWVPAATNKEEIKREYEVWQIHKLCGYFDRMGITLQAAGAGNRILSNFIRETFDGINVTVHVVETLAKPLIGDGEGRDTEIAWNTVEDVRDSGIEIGGGAINLHVHDNVFRRTHGGFRFKLPRIGPVYIHHNLLEDDRGFNFWFSMDASTASGYIYQNTIVGHREALVLHTLAPGGSPGIGIPRWHFLNNLIVTDRGYFTDQSKGAIPVNFTSRNNVVVGGRPPWKEGEGNERDCRYVDGVKLGPYFAPDPASAAIGAGLVLSRYLDGKPLPGCEMGTFTGAAPSAGARP
ncbi:MAG: right-handed parallel beta-helix repeat-containing protein [Spirochaetes bacterium]|nr:right-handed parallel beta-helix repeat-containing protein [Spirochaetota bacterium]